MMAASSNGVYFSQAGPCFQLALLECHKGGPAPRYYFTKITLPNCAVGANLICFFCLP